MAGELIMQEVHKYNVQLLPIDSEHSAIWQCLQGHSKSEIKRIILTASGGSFRNWTKTQLEKANLKDALKHPTWNMGAKITIDSATLMNKGLEIIEAHWLFNIPLEKIDVIIHPQSIIHSLVEFNDGSILAQLSVPDMRIPIQYALTYPEHLNANFVKNDFFSIANLTFEKPNYALFPSIRLAYDAIKEGGTTPAVLNAANEIVVKAFLEEKIGFMQIPKLISKTISAHNNITNPNLEQILAADKWSREYTKNLIDF